jgi:general secretion pathway protein A
MYCKHFGFSKKPFDVTPDHRFLYLTYQHREALASIMYGIKERRGFVALVGEAGTGKTTLLRAALSRLDKKTASAFIFNSDLPFIQVMAMILDELGILKGMKKLTLISAVRRLNDFAIKQFSRGGNVVIMVDEAQNFDPKTIEGLRLLSNLESSEHKMIQVILAGQPGLDRKLSKRAMQQFTQRISLRRTTKPLDEKHAFEYIRHRLKVVGYRGPDLFSKKAMNMIWQHSKGIPRRINVLCDNALLNAYGMGQKKIKALVVAEAINDLSFGNYSSEIKYISSGGIRSRLKVIQNKAAMF